MSRLGVAPIIVVGMHRSGTTLLMQILEELGVFPGYRLNSNREAKFFTKLNDWALRQTNASWDDPGNYRYLDEFHRAQIERVFRRSLENLRRLEYLGPLRTLRYPTVERLDRRWAWKDPRNTFTLDLWAQVFPTARILNMYRHPIDVAVSLRARELDQRKRFRRTWATRLDEFRLTRRPIYSGSARLKDIEEGLGLWRQYVARMDSLLADSSLEVHSLCYEELVRNPLELVEGVCRFLELPANEETMRSAASLVTPSRAFAFSRSAELAEYLGQVATWPEAARLGYGREPRSL